MRRWPYCTLLLITLAVALAGCGSEPDALRATTPPAGPLGRAAGPPEPAGPLELTHEDLLAALPEGREVFPWRARIRCGGRAACTDVDEGAGRAVYLDLVGRESRGVPEYLLIATIAWPSARRAARGQEEARTGAEAYYAGRFDHDPVDLGEGRYRYGTHGRGQVTTLELAGWSGFRREDTTRLEHLDGRTSARFHEVYVLLTRDRWTVEVGARTLSATGPHAADAEVPARLSALLRRLDELGR